MNTNSASPVRYTVNKSVYYDIYCIINDSVINKLAAYYLDLNIDVDVDYTLMNILNSVTLNCREIAYKN